MLLIPWHLMGRMMSAACRIFLNVFTNLLDSLADHVDVGAIGQFQVEFHHHAAPVVVGDRAHFTERDDLQCPFGIPKPDIAYVESFHSPLDIAAGNPFADPKRVIGQESIAGEHIFHQFPRPKADRQAHHPGTGQEGGDIDAHAEARSR